MELVFFGRAGFSNRGEWRRENERMEGAGESIVSHAAELAIREMDSAHEERLPSAIQDLVRRLEGQGEPITRLPDLSSPEFREFFRASLSTIIGWRSQVRFRVLEAIGRCNTLEYLKVRDICEGDLSRLTASEWEWILRGFISSTVLRRIDFFGLTWNSDAEVEYWCLQLGRILNSSSLAELNIGNPPYTMYNNRPKLSPRLSARCFFNLASGLRGHSDSKLKSLHLHGAWEDESAVKHVADMISSAPLLETLRLGGYLNHIEDLTVGILSQALIKSSSLKELELGEVVWGEALLLKALAGDDRNRSIERLRLWGLYTLIVGTSCLRELLISNPSLKEVELKPELCHQLVEVIRDDAIATTILVKFHFKRDDSKSIQGDDWKSIEGMACSASSDVRDPTVELELFTLGEDHVMLSLNLLGRVLRGEVKSLKSLSIFEGDKKIITFSILPMNGKTGETSVLKRLELSVGSEDLSKGVWEDLLWCMRGNHLTHLDLSNSELDEEAFRDLMGVLQVNLALQEIDVSRTSWATDGRAAQIQEALKQNKERASYMSVFREANLTFGDAKAGRLFLCGSPRAGELIALGQNFQAQEPESSYSMSSYASKDGFVSEIVFAGLIEKFLKKQPRFQNVDRKVLENILINLDLCFKLEDNSKYFIPSFIPEHASREEQNDQEGAQAKKWKNSSETSKFVGIRIQCQDETTMSLTAAFFPRFQMFMRRKLISKMGVSEENVTCSRHYLQLFHDGHRIYIEHVQGEKSHKFVDVLMLCSSQKSKEVAITYVRKHIVQELISFCASPKGCPGVALVLGVIQNFCVEMLIPSHLRGSILIEQLKSDFLRSINEKLEEIPLERSHLIKKEDLLDYEHCWPEIGRYTSERSERARDLLFESDLEVVVNEIRQNRDQQLKSLHEGIISVEDDLAQCYPEGETMVSGSNVLQMKDLKPPRSNFLSRSITSVENRSTQLLLSKIGQLEEKVDGLNRKVDDLDERLREVQSIMRRVDMKVEHILSVQQELQSKLSIFMSKVDMIIGYSEAFQQGNTPKRPYVTDDVGLFCRLSARLHVGKIVRLHLMCPTNV
ncbi:hypothetical protein AXG93_3656s1000 [Marchantia polymorpha subsp. ruderalis]|uniref:Uncharacterized protein n=1 Tax=Marchantia polymorpha subsp. ruderalis TaxID=1480154 RepID=A0A176WRE9_MARPO|nr:hypothetical protein AXG93_3656s1000 [Marchantia polymorpha subsp. ruderalis]